MGFSFTSKIARKMSGDIPQPQPEAPAQEQVADTPAPKKKPARKRDTGKFDEYVKGPEKFPTRTR